MKKIAPKNFVLPASSIRIRRMIESNLSFVKKIEVESGLSHWTLEDYKKETKRIDSISLVALFQKKVVGFIVGRLIMSEDSDNSVKNQKEAEIYNLAVKPVFRLRGIGQMLLGAFITEAESKRAISVFLEVRQNNFPAKRFYEKNGFVKVYERKNFYNFPVENAEILRRDSGGQT